MTAEQKARELINMYYNCNAKTQLEAVEQAERAILGTLCQKIDSLHGHIFFRKDFDEPLVNSSVQILKDWQEVVVELQNIKNLIQV